MTDYAKLPTWADATHVHAVVETPRGSRVKLNFDPKLQVFMLRKSLMVGLTYPYDWGFIPSTCAEDGDPLDILIIHEAPTYPASSSGASPSAYSSSCKGKTASRNETSGCSRCPSTRRSKTAYGTSAECLPQR